MGAIVRAQRVEIELGRGHGAHNSGTNYYSGTDNYGGADNYSGADNYKTLA